MYSNLSRKKKNPHNCTPWISYSESGGCGWQIF